MSATKQSTPILVFDPNIELMQGACESKYVTPDMIKVVGNRNVDPGYLNSEDEYSPAAKSKNPQHSMMVDFPACNLVSSANQTIRGAEIQEGTAFKCVVKKKKMYLTVLPQETPPPNVRPQGQFKDRFERTVVPKYAFSERSDEYSDTTFRNLTTENLLKVNSNITRFFSFNVAFDRTCEQPDEHSFFIFFQIHQAGGAPDDVGGAPPFAMRLQKGPAGVSSNILAQMNYLSPNGLSNTEIFGKITSQYKEGEKRFIQREGLPLKREVNYQFKFELNPMNPVINGVKQKAPPLRIWMNEGGEDQLIFEKNLFWGYNVTPNKPDTNRMSIKLGVYRRRHNRTSSLIFGAAKYGPTLKSVR